MKKTYTSGIIVPENPEKVNPFEQRKRAFETAYAVGGEYTAELLELCKSVAVSVVNTCIDPQRKSAPARDTVSNGGINPAMVDIKRGLYRDCATLENTRINADKATRLVFNADGDAVTETANADALNAFNALVRETLTDGIDLVQTAALALLEQASEHAVNGIGWLDTPYTVRRLSRRVYIRLDDSAEYADTETTPIQEVYRAVRDAVENSRAVQTDPRNGYTYIEDIIGDSDNADSGSGLDVILYRSGKYADIGGIDCNGAYTGSAQIATDLDTMIERLSLSVRQAKVLDLRLRGYGKKAIGTYLGIDPNNVGRTLRQIQKKYAEVFGTEAE